MASWIVHLRVAEDTFSQISGLDEALFAIGNIAPDSGIPDEKWEHFNPPPEVTHFSLGKGADYRCADLDFFRKYLLPLRGKAVDPARFSFILGYYFHLLTDNNWARRIGRPTQKRYADQFAADRSGMWEAVKNDWYGLDHRYVQTHPDSLFWRVFRTCHYDRHDLDFLPLEAVQQRVAFIQEMYQQRDAETIALAAGPFVYLPPQELEAVVAETICLCQEAYRLLWVEGSHPGEAKSILALMAE